MKQDASAYSIRISQMLAGMILLALAYLTVKSMMGSGQVSNLKMISGGIVGVSIILALDRYYWMLCPLGFWVGQHLLTFPGPLGIAELGCLALIGTHFVRGALLHEKHDPISWSVLWAVPFFAWVAISFIINPPGSHFLGNQTLGAKDYFRIILGFWTMLTLSRLRISEQDARILYRIVVPCLCFVLLRNAVMIRFAQPVEGQAAQYELLVSNSLLLWLLARYSLTEVTASFRLMAATSLLFLVAISTGKRRTLVSPVAYLFYRSFVTGRSGLATAVVATAVSVLVGLIVLGQGHLYDLPLPIQRTLSVIPGGKWDASIEQYAGGRDGFREMLRQRSMQEIRANPWLGRKGFAMDMVDLQWMYDRVDYYGMEIAAISANWHNIWLGMAADFGIPASVFWAVFNMAAVTIIFKKLRSRAWPPYQQTLILLPAGVLMTNLLFSHTSGHSAVTSFTTWCYFGVILAVKDSDAMRRPSLD